jgi:hypothetical protein
MSNGAEWQQQQELEEYQQYIEWFDKQGEQREDKRLANQNLKGFARRANGDQLCLEGCDQSPF